ncbi:MAG TPA: NAD(P)H-hydrate dehydratase [Gammaproteobacteria bacterium]|nr:NAD(P)H-hydrate dehydratase [Gammaproteobacteria bacterium]
MSGLRDNLPEAVYAAAQVRAIDRAAIDGLGILGYELMSRAGRFAFDVLRRRWPEARKLVVYCGAGNNAGDGYVVARLAHAAGLSVRVEAAAPPERLGGDAQRAWQDARGAGLSAEPFDAAAEPSRFAADVVVDALLGTGLARTVEGRFADAVDRINESRAPVLAIDVPSGLDADTGWPLGRAVRATVTATFVGLKQGLFLGAGPDYCGEIEFSDLAVPPEASAGLAPSMRRMRLESLKAVLPPRARTAHKGTNGRLLLVGGAPGTAGAIRLAAEAALRVGAGLVYVATDRDSAGTVLGGRPELMCRPVARAEDLDPLLEVADGVVLGPGLGRSEWSRALWRRVVAADRPLVVDADGLNLLAELGGAERTSAAGWVLTPHPGEAGRLLGSDAEAVQRDRLGSVRELAARHRATAVLKGACTLVASRERDVRVCDYGNPGMGTAGVGDVLAGVVGGLLVQLRDVGTAARTGVLLHARAGDDAAAEGGERGLVAGDLFPALRRWSNPR